MSQTLSFTPVVPQGETILITGVNGYIAAQVADQALAAGYKVRGTVRTPSKAQWAQELFDKKYGTGKFSLFQVENIHKEGAFDEAMKDVSAVAHIATDTNLSGEPEPYIPTSIASTLSFLTSASKFPQIKRVVLTSSSLAAVPWETGKAHKFDTSTYNETYIKRAYTEPFTPEEAFFVYAASKALSEREAWKWVSEKKPDFELNTVLPAANFGKNLGGGHQSTGGWAKLAYEGDFGFIQIVQPQNFIDVVDDAKLHLGALIHPDIKGERIFGFGGPYSWNTVIETFKKIYPEKTFSDGIPGLGEDLSQPPVESALFVLKSFGQDGFKSLEQSLREGGYDS